MSKTSQLLLKGTFIGSLAILASAASAQWVPGPGCGMANPNFEAPCFNSPCYQQLPPCYTAPRGFMGGPGYGYQDRKAYILGSLNLNDSQKPAWNNYSAAIDALHAQRGPNKVQGQQLDQQQLLEARAQRLQQRLEATQNLIKARAEFLKVLTPEQAKTFEALENRSHFRGHRGPRHGFGPHHGFGPQGAPAQMPRSSL